MNTEKFGGTGHGMPAPLPEEVSKHRMAEETAKRKQQTENFAKDSLPTKESVTTTIHESKHFPFQIIENITINNNTQEETHQYKVGVGGAFLSEKIFKTMDAAQKYISSRPWELITNLICFTIQNALEYEKSQSKR